MDSWCLEHLLLLFIYFFFHFILIISVWNHHQTLNFLLLTKLLPAASPPSTGWQQRGCSLQFIFITTVCLLWICYLHTFVLIVHLLHTYYWLTSVISLNIRTTWRRNITLLVRGWFKHSYPSRTPMTRLPHDSCSGTIKCKTDQSDQRHQLNYPQDPQHTQPMTYICLVFILSDLLNITQTGFNLLAVCCTVIIIRNICKDFVKLSKINEVLHLIFYFICILIQQKSVSVSDLSIFYVYYLPY